MKRHIITVAGIAAIIFAGSFTSPQVGAAPVQAGIASSASYKASTDARRAVVQAAAGFYRALNEMFTGNLTLMKEVWSHAGDVTYMGPGGGFQVGWPVVFAEFERQARMKLGGSVSPVKMRITVGGDLAAVSDYERGENTNADGKTEIVSLRATNIFRKEGGAWKMIGHHTDLLPYLKK